MYYLFSIFIFLEFDLVDKLRSGTRRLFPTLCPGTAPTTENAEDGSHARVGRSRRQYRLWKTRVGEKTSVAKQKVVFEG